MRGDEKVAVANKKKIIRDIYEALPKLNCGLCGHGSCGQFARAVVEGKASPFSCRQNPWLGYKISEIIGVKIPEIGYRYGFYQPLSAQRPEPTSPASLRKEVGGLSQRVDDILARIEKLGK
jgi:Na+-translocating ferredoxin:NAD+ oxidoreductase RNF subunit RnfB